MNNIDDEYERLIEHLYDCTRIAKREGKETIKECLKERRAEVLAEAAKAGKSTRDACRDFASSKSRMTALPNPKKTTTAS
ncbi:hypothetical protein RB195_014444 [Necator americanus]|uniref:Uncharacterized protein n=1 Tax=Necator americanus TaxID=51031 RepID=A0ABR1E024_NECAM